MSDGKEVKRWETISIDTKIPGTRPDADGVPRVTVVSASDHDRIMAERDELWKRATKFVMPGEMDTGESIEHYIETLEQTVAELKAGTANALKRVFNRQIGYMVSANAFRVLCEEIEKYDPFFKMPNSSERKRFVADRNAEMQKLKETVARQARVIEKLKRYTQHRVDCICRAGVLKYSLDCDCGLAAIEREREGT